MAKFKLRIGAEEMEIETTRQGNQISVTRDGETAVLHLFHSHHHQLALVQELPDGRRRQIRLAGQVNGDKRQLWVNGRLLHIERVRERAEAAAADGSLASSIPAVVSQILVKPGDAVTAGQKLILLESMKMVIPIQAPRDGTITAIHCAAGESIQAGVPLVALD